MADDSVSTDGSSIKVKADVDQASFQKAERELENLDKLFDRLAKTDFKPLLDSLKGIGKAMGAVAGFTITNNLETVQNMLKQMRTGLTMEGFTRWTSIEGQTGQKKGALTENMAEIYRELNEIQTTGDFNKSRFVGLGQLGVNADKFIQTQDPTERINMGLNEALKSARPTGEVQAMLSKALGEPFVDLYNYLRKTKTSFAELYSSMTVFADDKTQQQAAKFNKEFSTLMSTLDSAMKALSGTLGEFFSGPLEDINNWIRDNKNEISNILTGKNDITGLSSLYKASAVTGKWGVSTRINPYVEDIIKKGPYDTPFEKLASKVMKSFIPLNILLEEKTLSPSGYSKKGNLDTTLTPSGFKSVNATYDMKIKQLLALAYNRPDLIKELNELTDRAEKTKVPMSVTPGINKEFKDDFYADKKIIEDLNKILKREGLMDKNASVQQTNSIQLSFPSVTTREQAVGVGEGLTQGLGAKISRAIGLTDQATGAFGV